MNKILAVLIAFVVCAGLYWGFITFFGKSMKSEKHEGQGAQLEDQQNDLAEQIKKKQKLLMEEREENLRDYKNRNR